MTDIFLYDEIGVGRLTDAWLVSELAKAIDPITVHVNSLGGSIFQGLAMYTAISKQAITVEIDGIAASIAAVISMAGRPVRMAANAMLMIHNATAITEGDAAQLRKQAATLEQVQAQLVDIYARKTGLPAARIEAMLQAETWLSATEAHALGFVDEIMQPMKMTAHFDLNRFMNAPIAAKPTPRLDAYRNRYADLTGP